MASDLASRLAVQSFTFRHFKRHEEVIQQLKASGVDKLEMSGVHFNPASEDHASVLKTYREGGIGLVSYGVHGFGANEAADRKILDFARLAGFPAVAADFVPGGVEGADKLAAEYGKELAVHNHGRKHRLGSVEALEELFRRTSEHIGLCLDTAWMLDSGEDPVKVAQRFRDRLYGVHVKDFVFDRAGRPEDVIVGSGNLDLDGLIRFLAQTNYDGSLVLEYEGDEENPAPATGKCVEAVHAACAKLG